MIYLGYATPDKQTIVSDYKAAHAISKTVVISHERFPLPIPGADQVGYADVIMYVTLYRLLQEIDANTLVVVNECLRTQNRYDLTYNCIRNYLNQTPHVLVFQALPLIDTPEDFMILFDFATRSRWKRRPFDAGLILDNARVAVQSWPVDFRRIDVPTSAATQRRYEQEREKLFAQLGAKDPHTLPRNLYLLSGKDKLAWIENRQPSLFDAAGAGPHQYVARNKRLGNDKIVTYDNAQPGQIYTVLELPHRFIDFSDFLVTTGQAASDVLVADLKVDHWYFDRYTAWKERIHATYASLRG
jgi:hypothetical protein